jgi:hypothetical protein
MASKAIIAIAIATVKVFIARSFCHPGSQPTLRGGHGKPRRDGEAPQPVRRPGVQQVLMTQTHQFDLNGGQF